MKNRHLILIITMVCLLCSGSDAFGQTHVYITGSDTGSGSDFPSPPSGTPAANKVTTFKAAIDRANAVEGNVVIHLRTNKLNETAVCAAIKSNVNVQVINDTPARKAIRLKPSAYTSNHRWIGVNGTLTLGGDGCTSVLIIRGQNSDPYYYPTNTDGTGGAEIPPIVLIKANEGTVNIDNNCEVCYGKVNVWISYKTGVVNLKAGAVIHSALDMNVNITQGTFNMSGGYIMGHYKSTGNVVPAYSTAVPDNRILDYDTWIPSKFTKNGTMDYHLDRYEVRDVLEAYYPLQTTTQNGQTVTDPKAKINNAIGVYVHDTKDASGNHLAKFNMTGGAICGIYGGGSHDVIVDASGANFTYYTVNGSNTRMASHPVMVNGGYFKMDGGKIYANHITSSGGGVMILSNDFDATDPDEDFEHAHFYMTDGEISYCSGGTGGGLRIEYGATVEMSGGKITHCVSVPSDSQLNDPNNGQGGGSGGIRMVSSKFVMSNTAEISWCHSPTVSVGQSGGAIGAVWQPGFGYVYTTVELNGGSIHDNKSRGYGGAVAATDKGNTGVVGGISVTIKGCKIKDNQALIDGGGIYVGGNTTVEIKNSSEIYGNTAGGNGGGVLVRSESADAPCTLDIRSSQVYQNTAVNGGGVYVHEGTFNLYSGAYINDNDASATGCGGGVYMDGGEFNHYGGEIGRQYGTNGATANTAQDGAGVYMDGGTYNMSDGYINANKASRNGGGVYMGGGTFNLSGGYIGYGSSTYRNTATNGAGVYMANGGSFYMTDGYVEGNYASNNGGGVYMSTGGTCSVTGGYIGENENYHNEADFGGGIYSNGGNITIDGGNVQYNVVTSSGGGIHCYSGTVNVISGNITNNSAGVNGGGILANGTVNFSNGSINNNTATTNGGGVSINGTLNVSGTAEMTGNNAVNGNGGGVYQGGTMTADGTQLRITGNTAGSAKALTTNNVYLPNNKTIQVGTSINAESVELGITTQNIASVGTDIPVLTTVSGNEQKLADIYDALLAGTSRITDDRRVHKPKYPGAAPLTLYFTKYLYDYDAFTSDFQNPIDSRIQLYKFMCWVNGLNGFSTPHPNAVGIVTADIDMNNITRWIPIGEKETATTATTPFTGKLLSKASYNSSNPESAPDALHVISNLYIDNLTTYSNYGLFGITQGAEISGVIMEDCDLNTSTSGYIGSIIGLMKGGVLMNCGGSGSLTTTSSGCVMGGLVGRVEKTNGTSGTAGLIHSCYSTLHLNGYEMGGVVGQIPVDCALKNSFANAKFHSNSLNHYNGGLVGTCNGIMDNCYVREQAGGTHSNKYGMVVGGASGTITNTYYPTGTTQLHDSNSHPSTTTWSSFAPTATPYQYLVFDNQMVANASNSYIPTTGDDKGLLKTLNNWVDDQNNNGGSFTSWMRTSASPINGDYPVLDFPEVCLVSKNNVDMIYSNDFNNKFERLLAANAGAGTGTIYIYNNPTSAITSTLSNNNKATELYIHEDVVLLHSSIIKAHVGITLDNSAGVNGANPSFGGSDAIDWHFFSSALADAPIGLTYGDQSQYNLGVYPAWHAQFTDADGYFPTNLNDVVGGDDYYNHWDLYGYCEPDYHWINYKRNSASHWHEDWPDIHITYTNDTEFVPGRGYMVALKKEGFLQAYGTLNTDEGGSSNDYTTIPVTCTSSIGWTTREGHNLLGNPYQSYLDFDAFAEDQNNATLWNNRRPFYIIIDEDKKDYVLYTKGQSSNPLQASRFLHPHQGFMIDVDVNGTGTARFSNAMRTTSTTVTTSGNSVTWPGDFRGGEVDYTPCYPLVNLMATDVNGNRDIVTVELGRPDTGGALKQDALRMGKGCLWCHYEDEDYALVFTQPGLEAANIRFTADEDTEFTMTWSTHNGEFSYLHLIDNIAGKDIDCLQQTEYAFTAKTTDYVSRFRLVFDYTGVEENGDNGTMIGSETFAYYVNGEIHLTDAQADATLQIIDMLGRVIVSRDAVHTVSTSGMTPGVYVLRLTTANGTRTQKIVLN